MNHAVTIIGKLNVKWGHIPFLVLGMIRVLKRLRRVMSADLRLVSTPDDYFSLAGVEVFFLFTVMALVTGASGWMKAYFITTTAFLFYVPFSKVSHYVQWFFARDFFGVRFGRRGIITPRRANP
jgi:nitrate reductase gamma subunit